MKKNYKVGEFAKNLGVSTGFLKHHEQHGLLTPQISSSGYRFYEFANAMQAVQCMRLQNIGFTGKQISNMLNDSLNADISGCIANRKEELRKSLRFQNELMRYLDEWYPDDFLAAASTEPTVTWNIVSVEPFYYLENANEGAFYKYDEETEKIVRNWNQYAPITTVCTHITLDDHEVKTPTAPSISSWKMGICIPTSYAANLGVLKNEAVHQITPGKCLLWTYAGKRERKTGRDHIPAMLSQPLSLCREHNFVISGEIYTFTLFGSTAGDAGYIHEIICIPLN